MAESTDLATLLEQLRRLYEDDLPFNRLLGLKVRALTAASAVTVFSMRDELVGNPVQQTLHGGVISAVLDATGGLLATASRFEQLAGRPLAEVIGRIARVGTIDLRVDYLRPGRGVVFSASATVMRSGRKVAVTRMELCNEADLLIAVGTGTYLVG